MKKVLIIFLVLICTCGIGYIGYVIFNSKNIDSVELVGNIQTLYVVGDEIDYEDAKLKVTYKNGTMKYVDLDSKNVEVTYFSTSVETHAKMNILYKSAVIPVEYNVIQTGAYYLKSYKKVYLNSSSGASTTKNNYTLSNTKEMIYIGSGGICYYYTKNSGSWKMIDGNYNSSLNWTIIADKLTVNLPSSTYEIKAEYLENGKMNLISETYDNISGTELIRSTEEKIFDRTDEMKVNQTASKVKVAENLLNDGIANYNIGQAINESNPQVFLEVTYLQYSAGHQFRKVYVQVEPSMIVNNFSTSNKNSTGTYATLAYAGFNNIELYYKVV